MDAGAAADADADADAAAAGCGNVHCIGVTAETEAVAGSGLPSLCDRSQDTPDPDRAFPTSYVAALVR